MSEWLKEHAWKACRLAKVSQVRILSLPPGSIWKYPGRDIFKYFLLARSEDSSLGSLMPGFAKQNDGALFISSRFPRGERFHQSELIAEIWLFFLFRACSNLVKLFF